MKNLRDESGSVLVFVTLTVVILLIMVGMGLDTGWLAFSRSMGQRAVDMAALSGAAGLAQGTTKAVKDNVEATINDYVKVSSNTIDGTVGGKNVMLVKYDSATGTITSETNIGNANGVRVALEATNPYTNAVSSSAINTSHFLTTMLNLLGISSPAASNVDVSGVAVYSAIPGIPLALGGCEPTMVNKEIIFDQAPSSEGGNNSGWTTYTERETNTPDIVARINAIVNCQGGGAVGIGTPICLGNGTQPPGGQRRPVARQHDHRPRGAGDLHRSRDAAPDRHAAAGGLADRCLWPAVRCRRGHRRCRGQATLARSRRWPGQNAGMKSRDRRLPSRRTG